MVIGHLGNWTESAVCIPLNIAVVHRKYDGESSYRGRSWARDSRLRIHTADLDMRMLNARRRAVASYEQSVPERK